MQVFTTKHAAATVAAPVSRRAVCALLPVGALLAAAGGDVRRARAATARIPVDHNPSPEVFKVWDEALIACHR